eukprot:gnl/MRDRNA2_/MRDRNA2_131294_c0_seq1.p2 gnl/MRDRNA2_/MRDRNA2_131294_c0~~gnl/MRDRNA2_/MRDRNA2_131294_c0_seq1.p2  ORF type:complete len:107 (+),score=8.57 gnl/MRDRNA2_/MRDRNA2_131294_c0_seq1:343-663(+)
MFPLRFALKGKKGISPIMLLIQIKKNNVSRKGMYFAYFFSPILGMATSSRIKTTRGSVNLAIPLGTPALSYFLADNPNIKTSSSMERNMEKTNLVMEKSMGAAFEG